MKINLSEKAKTNVKAGLLTAVIVIVILTLITLLFKYPVEFIAICILIGFASAVGGVIWYIFMVVKGFMERLDDIRKG